MKITGEKVFSVPEHFFSISGSTSGYTLNYGNDGKTWAEWDEPTPENTPLFVANAPLFGKYKLVGNTGEVEIKW